MEKREVIGRRLFLGGAAAGLLTSPVHARADEALRTPLRYQGWPGRVSFPELAQDLGYMGPVRLEWVGNTISGPQDIQAVITRDVDFGLAFNGAVLKMIAYGAPARAVIAASGATQVESGELFVLENSRISGASDLRGRSIGVNVVGAELEVSLDHYLQKAGLGSVDDAAITLVPLPPVAMEGALRMGRIDAAFMAPPWNDMLRTRGGVRSVFSEYDVYGDQIMSTYVMRSTFLQKYPQTARYFVSGTARAIEWARNAPRQEVIARAKAIVRARGRGENTSPLDYWKTPGIPTRGGMLTERSFTVFQDWYVENGSPELKDINVSKIYDNGFNCYDT